jgi:hypothetical protein
MQYLNGVYGQKFNRANGRRGHLWQSRYHDRISTSDAEFLERYRYIALNAVEAGECDDPADYVWCSFGGTVAVAPPWRFVSDDLVLSRFGTGRDGIARLRDFVDERQLVRERHREIARRLGLAA